MLKNTDNYMKSFLSRNTNLPQLILITCIIFGLMWFLEPRKFMNYYNFESIAFSFPELGLLSIAMMISMLTGGIDLSVVAIANLTAILAGKLFQNYVIGQDLPESTVYFYVVFGIVISLGVGLLAGAFNGFLITRLGITPILATMGTGQLFTGIALVITGGPAIVGFPESWSYFGNGIIYLDGEEMYGIPVPALIFIIIAVLIALILTRTSFGIKLFLIGTSAKAAIYSGIKNNTIILQGYMLTGGLAALTGIIMSGRTNAAKSDYGTSYVLQAVLVAVLAGTNPAGGYGTVFGVFIAVIALMLLSSGLQIMRFSNFLVDFIWGAFLLTIMVVNYYNGQRRAKKRIA